MAYKDLLVHVDSSSHCAARLALAVTLARRFGAHLTGLHVMPTLAISPFIADQFPTAMLDEGHARIAQLRDDARASFAAASQPLGSEAEWRETRGDPVDAMRLAARKADLAILGQPDPGEDGADGADLPEQVVMGSGRPALLVPYAGTFAKVGERVLVAWNGSAQAARAVNDALPFLQGAERVVVVTVSSARGDRVEDTDIARHLARHGVAAEISDIVTDRDGNVGDVLLSRATDEAVDLIVMGAYGHSRLRELVLGGVSRALLGHMTVPVLMAH
jgi:nucleotide-binding universal stress UspA family protein